MFVPRTIFVNTNYIWKYLLRNHKLVEIISFNFFKLWQVEIVAGLNLNRLR